MAGYSDLTPTYGRTPGQLLDAAELADMTGFAPATLYRWRRFGRGPASEYVDGRIVWRLSSVLAWIEQRSRQGERHVARHDDRSGQVLRG